MAIADLRKNYSLSALSRRDLQADPIGQFKQWFEQAEAAKLSGGRLRKIAIGFYKWLQIMFGNYPVEPNAMTLATADKEGRPSARMVLLKGVDNRGFIFFTNYESRKGRELEENPHAALVLYWSDLERQICISGTVIKLPRQESEAYFKTRPKGSRIAAWASDQSEIVASRAVLEKKWAETLAQHPGETVPIPPSWGGYVLRPERIEFWQGRADRLHDRFCYTRAAADQWTLERLSP